MSRYRANTSISEMRNTQRSAIESDIQLFVSGGGAIERIDNGGTGITRLNKNLYYALKETSGLTRDGYGLPRRHK